MIKRGSGIPQYKISLEHELLYTRRVEVLNRERIPQFSNPGGVLEPITTSPIIIHLKDDMSELKNLDVLKSPDVVEMKKGSKCCMR